MHIDSIAAGGEGVGRLPDGRVLFVPRTAPGDLARVEITRRAKRWARGTLRELVEASPQRRTPPCPYASRCGGCALEHLEYGAQLAAKARIVADALARIGGIRSLPHSIEVVASPEQLRYRNRVSFTLRRRGEGEVVAGFHALGAPGRVVDVDGRCLLPEEPIARVWEALRAAWGPNARCLPAGEELRLTLRSARNGDVSLLIEGGSSPGRPEELLGAVAGLVSIWHRPGSNPAELLAGAPALDEMWGGEGVRLAGAAFLQVNRSMAPLLEAYVLEQAGRTTGQRVIDAYCGIGVHARRLARAGADAVGIEMDPHAVAEARRIAPPGARFEEGPVETLLPMSLPADLVILNPPRAGIGAEVAATLQRQPPGRLIYISCDPATLARDLRHLASTLRLESIRCFDLFPQTAHVESVAVLGKGD